MTPPEIPHDWSPTEALAVYDFIDDIRDAIWSRYQHQLIALMQEERVSTFESGDDEVTF